MPAEIWVPFAIRCGLLLVWIWLAWIEGRHAESRGYPFIMGFGLSMSASPVGAWFALEQMPVRPARISLALQLEIEREKARKRAAAMHRRRPGE